MCLHIYALLQSRPRSLKRTDFALRFSRKAYFRIVSQSVKANTPSSLLDRAAEQGWRGLGRLLWAGGQRLGGGQAEACR